MKNTLETRLGLFFALALAVAVLILELVGAFDLFQRGISIQTTFENVLELKRGDVVKMAGVEVGRVEAIDLTATNLALVRMKIALQYTNAIPVDSVAAIRATGLFGQNFVGLEAGKTNLYVTAGTHLRSAEPADLNVLITEAKTTLAKLGNAAESFSPENFSTLIGPLRDFITQNSPVLTTVIGNMRTVSDNLAQGKGTLGKLVHDEAFYEAAYGAVTNFQAASSDLTHLMAQADGMIQDARQVVTDINAGQGTVGRLVKDDSLFVQTTNAMANLGEILRKINQGQGTVGKVVNDETLYRNAKLTLQKFEKAAEGLEDQGPLSVLGIAVNTLF